MIVKRERTVGMQEVTFDLQTITPLFLAGADQTTAEIRAPSFRGLMRYWQRALVGGIVGTDKEGIKQVAEYESRTFGATDNGSPIQIRIHGHPQRTISIEREGKTRASATGKDYLLWSVVPKRPCIPPGTTFQVEIASRFFDERDLSMKRAVSSFWLLTHLGGIGTRSRRCAGSLIVTQADGKTFDFPFSIPDSVDELQKQLVQGISESRLLYDSREYSGRLKPSFDVLKSDTCLIWILLNNGNPWEKADYALRDIGSKLRRYRDTLDIEDRKIFGIPVMVMKPNGKPGPYPIQGAGSDYSRLASPIHLRLSELQIGNQKRFVGIAVLFKTRWEDMSAEGYEQYALIEKWIQQEFSTALRVTL